MTNSLKQFSSMTFSELCETKPKENWFHKLIFIPNLNKDTFENRIRQLKSKFQSISSTNKSQRSSLLHI